MCLVIARPSDAVERPNVVLIVVDDLAQDDIEHLPRLRSMIFSTGTGFARFETPNPLCGPSRASILRGQYSHNTGVVTNKRVFATAHQLSLEASTIATWLQKSGYATGLFGKYLNAYGRTNDPRGKSYVPPGWSEWYGGVPGQGFGFWLNHNGTVVRYPNDGPHANDVLSDLAVSFIWRNADRPMFLYIAPGSVHGDAPPAHRHEGEFSDAQLPQGPAFNEADVSDKPQWIRRLDPRPADWPRRVSRYRNRLRAMLSVEDLIAAVLRALTDAGVLEQTYIVFMSDNGFHYGEHRIKMSKATAYNEALLVPAAIRGPAVPGGAVLDHLVTNADLAPTIAEWTGTVAPQFVDGQSMAPLLRAECPEADLWRQAIGIEHLDSRAKGDGPAPSFFGVLLKRWKYVRYPGTDEEELYDLESDPYELQSLHETVAPACLSALREWAERLATCVGEVCRDLERNRATPPSELVCTTSGPPVLLASKDRLDTRQLFASAIAFDESTCLLH